MYIIIKAIGGGGSQVKFLILMILMIYVAKMWAFRSLWQNFKILPHLPKLEHNVEVGRFWGHFRALGGLLDNTTWKFGTFKYYYGPKSNEYV